ncbi:MAG: hypothetical protein R3A10_14505 [Caldilineaceae bacterium]
MFSLVLGTDEPPYDYHSYDATDHELYEELVGALIEQGVMPDDDSRSRGSCAMRDSRQDIAETLTALDEAVVEVKRGHPAATVFAWQISRGATDEHGWTRIKQRRKHGDKKGRCSY